MSSCPDWIFEIHQQWQSGFIMVYSNSYRRFLFEPEIIKIGPSSHKMYRNNIVNFQVSTPILNACTTKVWKLIEFTTYITVRQIMSNDSERGMHFYFCIIFNIYHDKLRQSMTCIPAPVHILPIWGVSVRMQSSVRVELKIFLVGRGAFLYRIP